MSANESTKRLGLLRSLLVHAALAVVGLIVAIPLYWTLISSVTTNAGIFATPVQWIPPSLHLENFSQALSAAPFGRYFFNSAVVGVVVTATTLVTSALAGYGFAKFQFPGRRILFVVVLIALMVPFQAIMIPLFVLARQLGWLNSYAGLIVPGAVSGFGIFLMRQFMSKVPDALLEAARLDGCNEIQLFLRIVLPLSRSALAALAVLTFLASWNNFLWPLIVAQNPDILTVPLGIVQFRGSYFTNYTQILAVSLMAAAPVIVLYLVMQRQIIETFASSGIKG
ncbi:MAG: binding-protein-dependent transport system inner rane component [Chloroflexi bacterium]|nr:binding-protein-dependent transport system inner rane component [Chloroflexota bacterium]